MFRSERRAVATSPNREVLFRNPSVFEFQGVDDLHPHVQRALEAHAVVEGAALDAHREIEQRAVVVVGSLLTAVPAGATVIKPTVTGFAS